MTSTKLVKRFGALLVASVAVGVAPAGCFTPASITCADGLICPPGDRCDDVNHRCTSATEAAACAGLDEGASCTLIGATGTCRAGICHPHFCGDGVRTKNELCDGNDLGQHSCSELGFYGQTTGLKCAPDCTLDKSGCSGRCGDGVVDGPDEQCDGSPPAGKTCLDYGYDSGLLGCSELCQPSLGGCDKFGWKVVGPSGYNAIWGSSPHDVFAVGKDILHWDGVAWSIMKAPPAPPPNDMGPVAGDDPGDDASSLPAPGYYYPGGLVGVWGAGPSDVWTVGGHEILHWDGAIWAAAWTPPPTLPIDWNFEGVWGTGPRDVYAFGGWTYSYGSDPLFVFHWDGANWSQARLPTSRSVWVHSMSGSGPNDVYALAAGGEELHWNGTSWSPIKIADQPSVSIWASAVNDAYAVGPGGTYHWDGSTWAPLQPPGPKPDSSSFVWGSGPRDVFLINGSTITHWDGVTWSKLYEGKGFSFDPTHPRTSCGVWGDGALESTWILADGGIMQLSRGLWQADPDLARLEGGGEPGGGGGALWGTGEDVFALAFSNGAFRHLRRGSAFGDLPPAPINTGTSSVLIGGSWLWGSAVDDIWASGFIQFPDGEGGTFAQSSLWRWNGSTWAATNAPYPGGGAPVLGGSSSSDVWAMDGSSARHWNGVAWSQPIDIERYFGDMGGYFAAVWSRSSTEAFAVGSAGAIIRWDGTLWHAMTSGTVEELTDVWGTARDVFAVGSQGTILRLEDGTRWTTMVSGTTRYLSNVRASSTGNVFVTAQDRLLHLRAGAWEPVAGLGLSLSPLWVTPSSVYVAGSRLDLLGVNCQSPEQNCNDGWDNDCDGLQDGADPDCAGKVVEQCANLIDDDGDGQIDCTDPDCANFSRCRHP